MPVEKKRIKSGRWGVGIDRAEFFSEARLSSGSWARSLKKPPVLTWKKRMTIRGWG